VVPRPTRSCRRSPLGMYRCRWIRPPLCSRWSSQGPQVSRRHDHARSDIRDHWSHRGAPDQETCPTVIVRNGCRQQGERRRPGRTDWSFLGRRPGTGLIAIMNGSFISIRNRLQMKFDYCLSCIHSWTSGTRVYDRSIGPTYGRR